MSNFTPKKVPTWEKTKKEKRKKRLLRYFVAAIILIAVVNLAIKIPGIYNDLNTPFKNIQDEKSRLESINTDFRTTIVLLSFEGDRLVDLALVTAEPVDKKLSSIVFNLPEYKKLSVLLNRSFRNGGEERLEKHLEISLGVSIDRYIALERADVRFDYKSISKVVNEVKGLSVFVKIFTQKGDLNPLLRTNLSTGELLRLGFLIRNLQYEESSNFQFAERDIERLRTDETAELIQNNFFDRKILEEGAAISIENSSGNPLAAVNLANFITNLGATVVTVDSVEEMVEEGRVIIKENEPSILEKLQSFYDFEAEKAEDEANFSGDILIKIGNREAEALTLD